MTNYDHVSARANQSMFDDAGLRARVRQLDIEAETLLVNCFGQENADRTIEFINARRVAYYGGAVVTLI